MEARDSVATWVLRVLAAACLAISGYIHLHLASRYNYPGTITGTQLFDAQGTVALIAAVLLLVTDNRWVWVVAAIVGLASFAAVMSSRYLSIGAIGPLPDMRDASWQPSPDKPLSAIVEGLVGVIALVRLGWALTRRAEPARPPAGS